MIQYVEDSLLNAYEVVIGHGVNTQGVMGKGVALQMRNAYPQHYIKYKRVCSAGNLLPGNILVCDDDGDQTIICLATQRYYGTLKPAAHLTWIAESMDKAIRWCISRGYHSMAIPRIGSGLGGLKWEAVEAMLNDMLLVFNYKSDNPFVLRVYTGEKKDV